MLAVAVVRCCAANSWNRFFTSFTVQFGLNFPERLYFTVAFEQSDRNPRLSSPIVNLTKGENKKINEQNKKINNRSERFHFLVPVPYTCKVIVQCACCQLSTTANSSSSKMVRTLTNRKATVGPISIRSNSILLDSLDSRDLYARVMTNFPFSFLWLQLLLLYIGTIPRGDTKTQMNCLKP